VTRIWARFIVARKGPTTDWIYSEHPHDEYSL
jgi:hypothetical protein